MNTELAQRWEKQFAYCTAGERSYQLQEPSKGLKVSLKDGSAFYHVESDPAYDQALAGLLELFARLDSNPPQWGRMQVTTQFLQPSDLGFESAMAKVHARLFNEEFPARVGGTLVDHAYLGEFMFGRSWVQISAGALRSNEVGQRVTAAVKKPPAVSYFSGIVGRLLDKQDITGRGTIELVDKLLNLGTHMAQEFDS